MDLTRYVESLRQELAVVAAAGGEEAEALADRLTAPLESAIRLTLLDALSTAAAEITRELAPGSVHLRLRGQDPDFVVTGQPEVPSVAPMAPMSAAPSPDEAGADKGAMSRINLRLPDDLKARVEEAAERERLSVNAWLVRAASSALDRRPGSSPSATSLGQHYTGWAS